MAAEPDFLPTYLHRVELVEEIRIELWRDAFQALGFPESLKPTDLVKEAEGHEKIVDIVFTEKLKPMWNDLFETIDEIGTAAGREVLLNALDEAGVDRTGWPADMGALELALFVWLRRTADQTVGDAVDRARVEMFATGTRRPQREFAGKKALEVKTNEAMIRRHVEQDASTWFQQHDRGGYVEVKSYLREGCAVFQVVHGELFKTEMSITDAGRSTIRFRPGQSDLIRYDAKDGRLRIAARSTKLVNAYRQIFGRALFGDPAFFSEQARCTLQPLQERGSAVFDEVMSSAIAGIRIDEVVWHPGAGAHWRIGSDEDALSEMTRRGLVFAEGTFSEATFEFRFANGNKVDPKRVTVRPPHLITNHPDRYADRIDKLLMRVGIRVAADPDGTSTVWDMFPWVHSTADWKGALGPLFGALMEKGLLVSEELETIAHGGVSSAKTDLRVVHNDERIDGISRADGVPSRQLNATEISGLKLDVAGFAKWIASELETSGPIKLLTSTTGTYDLGWRAFGDVRVHVFFLARRPAPGTNLADRLQREAGRARVLLITPPGCKSDLGPTEISVDGGERPLDRCGLRAIAALGLQREAPAMQQADPEARMVIDPYRGTIHLDGTHLASIPGESVPFRFLLLLARTKGTVVPSATITEELDNVAKDAARRTRETIELSFKRAGIKMPNLSEVFCSRGGGYILLAPCFVS